MKVKHFIYREKKEKEIRVKCNKEENLGEHIYKPTGRKHPEKGYEYHYCGSTFI